MGRLKSNLRIQVKKLFQGKYANSTTYLKYLRGLGMSIGEGTVIFEPRKTTIDVTRPWLIEIGTDVKITKNVTILTHGYDWSVLQNLYGEMIGSSGKVKIGNNVFIGMNSTILKGCTIGNNVIIGANSLVNKDFPDNVVIAGNPAKIIMSIDDYYRKRQNEYVIEAKELAMEYYNTYKKIPPINVFHEFYPLFLDRNEDITKYGFSFMIAGKESKSLKESFLNSAPIFNGYSEFLKWCGINN